MKYGTMQLKVLVVIQLQTADDAASSMGTTSGVPMETLYIVPGQLQMPQETSGTWSSHTRLGLRKLQTHERIQSLPPAPMPHWSPIQQSMHDEHVSFHHFILHTTLNAILKSDSKADNVTAPASAVE